MPIRSAADGFRSLPSVAGTDVVENLLFDVAVLLSASSGCRARCLSFSCDSIREVSQFVFMNAVAAEGWRAKLSLLLQRKSFMRTHVFIL